MQHRNRSHILLVDDDKQIIAAWRKILEYLKYQVTAISNSLEALEIFMAAPRSFDLVITDLSMPLMSGDRLAQEMLAIRHDIPIIFWTGYSNVISPEKARELGIKAYLHKPVSLRRLAAIVKKLVN